jgi:hypothetical protein
MYDSKPYYFNTSRVKIISYKIIRWSLIFFLSYFYFISWHWNKFLGLILTLLFAYCVGGVVSLVLQFFIYTFTKPKILKADDKIIKNGISSDVMVVFFRPIFAKSNTEMDTLLNSMEIDIINNKTAGGNQKYILIDNTRDESVKEYVRNKIEKLQERYGKDKVFYFHRNPKCDFFKKVGILHDAIMLLYKGWTKPKNYIDKKWKEVAKETRNPELPIWDEILGDIKELGINSRKEDILEGNDIEVKTQEKFKIAVVSDADNIWEKGEFLKLAAKILFPQNKDYIIYQPTIEILNPYENRFIWLTYLARRMYEFEPIARWRLFGFSPFYGKGAFQVKGYVEQIIESEWLNPAKAASHDFQESLRAWSVLVEDVFIYERTFSNKLSELKRATQWGWGDLETVNQYLFKKFQPGRKAHLFVLLRGLIACFIYSLWLVLNILFWQLGMIKVIHPFILVFLLSSIVLISILIPKLIIPIVDRKKGRLFSHKLLDLKKTISQIFKEAGVELLFSNLIHKLDLIYKPYAFLKNYIKQVQSKPYVWKTGAMGELETSDISPLKVYKALWIPPFVGIILLGLVLNGYLSWFIGLILVPYISSFLLGPYLVWYTNQKFREKK